MHSAIDFLSPVPARDISVPSYEKPIAAAPFRCGPTRFLLAGVGIAFAALAVVGVVLPGIPTTGPLIAASFFLAKSCPTLERKLSQHPLFAKSFQYIDGTRTIPRRVRQLAIGSMWTSIGLTSCLFVATGRGGPLTLGLLLASAVVGTVCIWRYRR